MTDKSQKSQILVNLSSPLLGTYAFDTNTENYLHHLKVNKISIGENVQLGNNTSIGYNVKIGKNSIIGENVTIEWGATIGQNSVIKDSTVIKTEAIIRENVTIGKFSTIGRLASIGSNAFIEEKIEIFPGQIIDKNKHIDKDNPVQKLIIDNNKQIKEYEEYIRNDINRQNLNSGDQRKISDFFDINNKMENLVKENNLIKEGKILVLNDISVKNLNNKNIDKTINIPDRNEIAQNPNKFEAEKGIDKNGINEAPSKSINTIAEDYIKGQEKAIKERISLADHFSEKENKISHKR